MGKAARKELSSFARAMLLAGEDVRKASVEDLRRQIQSRRYGECRTYTPDINALEHQQRHKIFVADDMMTGGQYHDYITEQNLFGRHPACHGYTEDDFTFWNRNLKKESYPIALEGVKDYKLGTFNNTPARIWGQVYSIRGSQFKKLDFLRENGYAFLRQRRVILIPHQKAFLKPVPDVSYEMKHRMECWMYVGIRSYWEPLLDGGFDFSPVKQITYQGIRERPWLERYYVYQNGHYLE